MESSAPQTTTPATGGSPGTAGSAPTPGSAGAPTTGGGGATTGGVANVPASVPDAGVVAGGPNEPTPPDPGECDASAPVLLGALGLERVPGVTDLATLSYAAQPPDSNDWYLVQQNGVIRVLSDGVLLPAPFYDVSDEIALDASYDERGLHAIEFAPDYATSGLFYIVLTPTSGERANRDLVLEHRRSEADPFVGDPAVVRTLLESEGISPNSLFVNIHNNYLARFGPDGMLYIGTGDGGGSCNDNAGFEDTPQQIASHFGKILRLDLSAPEPYAAADNPFVDSGDPRVLHYGLRNPFRFSWDAATGDLYIGDVGQDTHEEINVAPSGSPGLNFGWASYEGDEQVCTGRAVAQGEVTPPIFFTDHGGGGQFGAGCNTSPFCDYGAIVGGVVYRGTALPELYGAYLFGDWVSDNLAVIRHCDGATSEVTSIDYVRDPNLPNNGYLVAVGDDVPALRSITAVLEDHDRELYLVANANTLLKLVPAP